jgi:hypothetical protein
MLLQLCRCRFMHGVAQNKKAPAWLPELSRSRTSKWSKWCVMSENTRATHHLISRAV